MAAVKRAFSSVLRDLSSIVIRSGRNAHLRHELSSPKRLGRRSSGNQRSRPAGIDDARLRIALGEDDGLGDPLAALVEYGLAAGGAGHVVDRPAQHDNPLWRRQIGGGRGKRSSNGAIRQHAQRQGRGGDQNEDRGRAPGARPKRARRPKQSRTPTSAPNNRRLIGEAIIQNIFETKKNTDAALPVATPLCGKGEGLSQDAPSPTLRAFNLRGSR